MATGDKTYPDGGRLYEYGFSFAVENGRTITLKIDVLADTSKNLVKKAKSVIARARKQIGTERIRISELDPWYIWDEIETKGKSITELAQELTEKQGNINNDDTLKAKAVQVSKALARAQSLLQNASYPPPARRPSQRTFFF